MFISPFLCIIAILWSFGITPFSFLVTATTRQYQERVRTETTTLVENHYIGLYERLTLLRHVLDCSEWWPHNHISVFVWRDAIACGHCDKPFLCILHHLFMFVYLSFLTSTVSICSNPHLHVCTTFWYNDLITFFLVLYFVGLWCFSSDHARTTSDIRHTFEYYL